MPDYMVTRHGQFVDYLWAPDKKTAQQRARLRYGPHYKVEETWTEEEIERLSMDLER